ncbi:protein FAM3B [Rhinophrynus dorsalis]
MVSLRFLSSNTIKVAGLLCASACAWYMGYLFAEIIPEDSLQTAIGTMQKIGMKPVLKAPNPRRQKCDIWRACPEDQLAYRLLSGGAQEKMPEICLDDVMLVSAAKNNAGRGINIAVVNRETWKLTEAKTFDMYEGDNCGPMIDFINKIPKGSLIMISSHDDAFTKLNDAAKKTFEELGSKQVRELKFRSAWVFLAVKGSTLADNLEKEKINHSDGSKNRYSGWPAEIQIDGCLPKK